MSIPDRHDPEEHKMRYPRFREIEIDEEHLIINIVNPDPTKRNCKCGESLLILRQRLPALTQPVSFQIC